MGIDKFDLELAPCLVEHFCDVTGVEYRSKSYILSVDRF